MLSARRLPKSWWGPLWGMIRAATKGPPRRPPPKGLHEESQDDDGCTWCALEGTTDTVLVAGRTLAVFSVVTGGGEDRVVGALSSVRAQFDKDPPMRNTTAIFRVFIMFSPQNADGHPEDATPGLYVVATPIGNRRDITERARNVLAAAHVIVCEDTRTSGPLLRHYGVSLRALQSYHDHSNAQDRARIIQQAHSAPVALISDAGTPLIADPGYKLIRDARAADIPVFSVPGPCAAVAALSIAGLPTDQFLFAGFWRSGAEVTPGLTTLYYVSPHDLKACLTVLAKESPAARLVLCRELTKRFEGTFSGTPGDVICDLESCAEKDPKIMGGEWVLMVHIAVEATDLDPEKARLLGIWAGRYGTKQAAEIGYDLWGMPKKVLYQVVLDTQKDQS